MIPDFKSETLTIDHFGPIEHATLEIKDVNVFIGPTSSGKSTAAKLVAIFRDSKVRTGIATQSFRQLLIDYNINYEIGPETKIKYNGPFDSFEIVEGRITREEVFKLEKGQDKSVYVPAERILLPVVSQSIFGLVSNNVALPKCFLDFGARFERARKEIGELSINFLDAKYLYQDNIDYVIASNGARVKLSEAASGLQSLIPLLLVIGHSRLQGELFVVEEPELNLYPSAQKALMETLVAECKEKQGKLIITTHSPYLLTSLDNLIQAMNVGEEQESRKPEVEKVIAPDKWVSFDRVSCYYFKNGKAWSTLDAEMKSIGPSNIDDVSTDLSETFEKLLSLKYASI